MACFLLSIKRTHARTHVLSFSVSFKKIIYMNNKNKQKTKQQQRTKKEEEKKI
jgi:hypothetical protein